jgi:hypothetical protein
MKLINALLFSLLLTVSIGAAAGLPPEKLLPSDALAVVTVPDVSQYRTAFGQSATARLWADPSLKPFKEKFLTKLRSSVLEPLERDLGIRLEDYTGLVQGQFSLAVTGINSENETDQNLGMLLLVDSGEEAAALGVRLQELRREWVDAGLTVRDQRIRDVEFSVLIVSAEDVLKPVVTVFREMAEGFGVEDLPMLSSGDAPNTGDGAETSTVEIAVGQKGPLLLVGTEAKELEQVLARQAGGLAPSLEQNSDFRACYNSMLRDTLAYGWLNFRLLYNVVEKEAKQQAAASQSNSLMPSPDRLLAATGLSGLRGVALGIREDAQASVVRVLVAVPEGRRHGLFRLLAQKPKEASPPLFVPADVLSYSRWRLDMKESWAALESMITEISPQFLNMFQFALATMGGGENADFDFREDLIAHLGDDLISYMKPPREKTLLGLATAPDVMLVGSGDAGALLSGVRSMLSMLPPPLNDVKEREFRGRKICTVGIQLAPGVETEGASETISFVSSGGYLAISDDDAALEEYLRSSEASMQPLRDLPGLTRAAQGVGGMSTGMLGFENSREALRIIFDSVRGSEAPLSALLGMPPSVVGLDPDADAALREWLDFALLPEYDRIAKYIGLTLYSDRWTVDGYRIDMISPTPPEL